MSWSKVRPLLSPAKPAYVGTSFIETYRFDGEACYRTGAEMIGGVTLMAIASGKDIMDYREADGALHTYVGLNKPEGWMASIDFSDPATALARTPRNSTAGLRS